MNEFYGHVEVTKELSIKTFLMSLIQDRLCKLLQDCLLYLECAESDNISHSAHTTMHNVDDQVDPQITWECCC